MTHFGWTGQPLPQNDRAIEHPQEDARELSSMADVVEELLVTLAVCLGVALGVNLLALMIG
jgi:hypothetical protein